MLNVGEVAPAFSVQDHSGREVALKDFAGQPVVLWFYPKADTPGWTIEGKGFRDRIQEFQSRNVSILGVSFDSVSTNAAFAAKFSIPFPLLCDTDRKIGLAYGACDTVDAGYARRISYLIGADGRIRKVYGKVDVKTHADELLQDL